MSKPKWKGQIYTCHMIKASPCPERNKSNSCREMACMTWGGGAGCWSMDNVENNHHFTWYMWSLTWGSQVQSKGLHHHEICVKKSNEPYVWLADWLLDWRIDWYHNRRCSCFYATNTRHYMHHMIFLHLILTSIPHAWISYSLTPQLHQKQHCLCSWWEKNAIKASKYTYLWFWRLFVIRLFRFQFNIYRTELLLGTNITIWWPNGRHITHKWFTSLISIGLYFFCFLAQIIVHTWRPHSWKRKHPQLSLVYTVFSSITDNRSKPCCIFGMNDTYNIRIWVICTEAILYYESK